MARSPQPPRERAPWLPPRVSALILTLLAKEPDDRYQSAAGLTHDLRHCRQALTESRPLDQVPLKQHDWPLAPRPPRRLYGRNRELAILTAAFASVTAGGAQGLFVAGYSGVGKTSLIQEIHRPVTLSRGLLICGKFEQFSRERPFLAPAQSLRQLCQLLVAEPEAVVAEWRQRILAGVGPDAGALFIGKARCVPTRSRAGGSGTRTPLPPTRPAPIWSIRSSPGWPSRRARPPRHWSRRPAWATPAPWAGWH